MVPAALRLYDSLTFDVHRITLTDWPGDLRAAAPEWTAPRHQRVGKISSTFDSSDETSRTIRVKILTLKRAVGQCISRYRRTSCANHPCRTTVFVLYRGLLATLHIRFVHTSTSGARPGLGRPRRPASSRRLLVVVPIAAYAWVVERFHVFDSGRSGDAAICGLRELRRSGCRRPFHRRQTSPFDRDSSVDGPIRRGLRLLPIGRPAGGTPTRHAYVANLGDDTAYDVSVTDGEQVVATASSVPPFSADRLGVDFSAPFSQFLRARQNPATISRRHRWRHTTSVAGDAVTARYLLALLSRSAGDPKAANGPHNPFTPTRASSNPTGRCMTRYDRTGVTYSQTRRADPRVAAAINRAVRGAASVADMGAGSGSYEPNEYGGGG